jgi:hypothetical protein
MKRMWLQLKAKYNRDDLRERLGEIGKIEDDPSDPGRWIMTFHNQSESGLLMAGFRLSEEFIEYLDDFDMIREDN